METVLSLPIISVISIGIHPYITYKHPLKSIKPHQDNGKKLIKSCLFRINPLCKLIKHEHN